MIWRFWTRFHAALLTWAAGLGALFLLGNLLLVAALIWSYHPVAPTAFQIGPLIGIAALGLLALIILGVRHAALARSTRAGRNAAEVLAVGVAMALAATLVVVSLRGPKTQDVEFQGDTYRIPSAYRPYMTLDVVKRPVAIWIEVCGPERTPLYASAPGCRNYQTISFGFRPLLQEFDAEMLLADANATQSQDRLITQGRHRTDTTTGALVYSDSSYEMRLWPDAFGKAEVMRVCSRGYDGDCIAALRWKERTLFFPVVQNDATKTKAGLVAEGALWQARFDGWRCPTDVGCPTTP